MGPWAWTCESPPRPELMGPWAWIPVGPSVIHPWIWRIKMLCHKGSDDLTPLFRKLYIRLSHVWVVPNCWTVNVLRGFYLQSNGQLRALKFDLNKGDTRGQKVPSSLFSSIAESTTRGRSNISHCTGREQTYRRTSYNLVFYFTRHGCTNSYL